MSELLDKIDHGADILIDCNLLRGKKDTSITSVLYEGIDGWNVLDLEEINHSITNTEELTNLLYLPNTKVISEVLREFRAYRDILNNNIRYFEVCSKRTSKDKKKRYSLDSSDLDWIDIEKEKMNLLAKYSNYVFKVVHLSRNKDPRIYLTNPERQIYQMIYEGVERKFRNEIIAAGYKKVESMDSPQLLSQKLMTDLHLVSTAVMLSRKKPVQIATRDNQLTYFLYYAKKEIKKFYPREINKNIEIINPDRIEINETYASLSTR